MSSKTKNTQSADPWRPAQAPLEAGIQSLTDMYQSGGLQINPYQGDWVANQTQATTQGQQGLLGALGGYSDQIGQAQGVVNGLAAPGAWDTQRQNVINSIMPAINSSFAGSGMTGSSLHQQNLASGLSSGLANAEQGFNAQQLQAAGMIPGLADAALQPYQMQMQVGGQQQAQQQAEIDAMIQKNLLEQGAGPNALKDYLTILSGLGGQFGTQTATQSQRPGLLNIAGAGLQAASLF